MELHSKKSYKTPPSSSKKQQQNDKLLLSSSKKNNNVLSNSPLPAVNFVDELVLQRDKASQSISTSSEHVIRNRILLNAMDLKSLNIPAGAFVVVKETNQVCTVWASPNTQQGWMRCSLEVDTNNDTLTKFTISPVRNETNGAFLVPAVLDEIRLEPMQVFSPEQQEESDSFSESTLKYVLSQLIGSVLATGSIIGIRLAGKLKPFKVYASGIGQPSWNTKVRLFFSHAAAATEEENAGASIAKQPFAGLDGEFCKIVEMIKESFGNVTQNVRGVLIFGPSGNGKTLLCNKVCNYFCNAGDVEVTSITGSETLEELDFIFRKVSLKKKGDNNRIIFIDELDLLCPSRDVEHNSEKQKYVSTLLALMDDGQRHHLGGGRLFFLCATSKVEKIDSALKRPGRLDEEMEIQPPNARVRGEILIAHLRAFPVVDYDEEQVRSLGVKCYGFVAADIANAVRKAAWLALSHDAKGIELGIHLKPAIESTVPSSLKEVSVEIPSVKWDDIGGNESVKLSIREAVELPLKNPQVFVRFGITPPRGILLYGPPGCSKTLTAKAVATESEMNFIAVKGPELLSKWVGDSEKAVQLTFKRARAASPCIIFFDEIDALAAAGGGGSTSGVTQRVLAQLLQEMDGVNERGQVIVLGATNRPDLLGDALLRPGRFDRMIYIPPPDEASCREILKIHLRKMPLDFPLTELHQIKMSGFSGAEVASIAREGALLAVERDLKFVTISLLQEAASKITPQITEQMLKFYSDFNASSS